jgi:thiosulfate dehydrogenase
MSKFLIGLVLGLIVVPVCVYFYFSSGSAPVATAATPMPFEKTLARMALHARMDKEMPKSVPIAADEAAFVAGATDLQRATARCATGWPGAPQTAIAKGMFPDPPKLMDGMGVTDDPAQETYWKVAGGIRMTGMPGFDKTLSTTEMWQVSVLLANADKLPPAAQEALSAAPAPAAPAVMTPPATPIRRN